MAQEDCRLAEACGLDGGEVSFAYSGLAAVLETFRPGMLARHGATVSKSATVTSLDQVLAVSLVQREANLRSLADARREYEQLSGCRRDASSAIAWHRDLMARWTGAFAQWDPGLGNDLVKLESEERALLQRQSRLEAAQAAARDAENALNCLWAALQDAVDWIPVEGAPGEPPTAVLRLERLGLAEPWIFEVQVSLARARRALCGTEYLEGGAFQADVLARFAGWCIESMGLDVAERDGTIRSCRTVSWTLTTVRALRGYLTRSQVQAGYLVEDLRRRRNKMLSHSRS